MTMGEAAKEARVRNGMTIKELSALSGVHVNTIIDFEKDRIYIKINTAECLAHALGMEIGDYIGSHPDDKYKKGRK